MHELSLVESILRIVDEYAAKEGFDRVTVLRLSCGKLSCVVPQALRFAFEIQSLGTRAEGAALELEILPAVIHCLSCARDFEVDRFDAQCPECGGYEVFLVRGTEELRLLELEVE
ncbi:MAG TPA: hydrogenase maturation nickel metallochaperone HypA [Syntrophales bacterium]|nr:hydrogenase maturation nickel metallochaperone HypA [Syntrophales bacterium]HOM06608.1 hydrogenase maturation nickel metallochaperone HypA [Syntrophales bacterium]HON99758.1 hydrogenase maturation nickel metallochaperone HypA [Syntrophales bacterium]HPC01112.1 hydrogenase maturation nickel metallochaperone HypA [Syntrophales bacterium]HPQ06269.1 hydrogenase maturation nickel metallochaperone HypA [Syntrophales bacterium]